jgi:hypothetical protein
MGLMEPVQIQICCNISHYWKLLDGLDVKERAIRLGILKKFRLNMLAHSRITTTEVPPCRTSFCRTVLQASSCQSPSATAWSRSEANPCAIGGESGAGTALFLRALWFYPVRIIPPTSHISFVFHRHCVIWTASMSVNAIRNWRRRLHALSARQTNRVILHSYCICPLEVEERSRARWSVCWLTSCHATRFWYGCRPPIL